MNMYCFYRNRRVIFLYNHDTKEDHLTLQKSSHNGFRGKSKFHFGHVELGVSLRSSGDVEYTGRVPRSETQQKYQACKSGFGSWHTAGNFSHECSSTKRLWSEDWTKSRSLRNGICQIWAEEEKWPKERSSIQRSRKKKNGRVVCRRVGKQWFQGGSGHMCLVQVWGQGKHRWKVSFGIYKRRDVYLGNSSWRRIVGEGSQTSAGWVGGEQVDQCVRTVTQGSS